MPLEFNEWTKRLGQKHWALAGENETLCEKPMLGNNYARHLEEDEKEPCTECAEKKDILEGEGTPGLLKDAVFNAWLREYKSATANGIYSPEDVFKKSGFTGIFTGLEKRLTEKQLIEALEKL